MQLFCAPGTISVAAAIALHEAGQPFEEHRVDFAAGAQRSPAYAAINPKSRVPALVVDGTVLTETGAILEFIAAQAPALLPRDPLMAAHARSVMYYLASTMHVNHAHKMRGPRWADLPASHADMTAKVPETMTASAAYIEAHALRAPFVTGRDLSLADPYLFQVCTWLPGDGVDLTPFPRLQAFMAAMERRDSVRAVRASGLLP